MEASASTEAQTEIPIWNVSVVSNALTRCAKALTAQSQVFFFKLYKLVLMGAEMSASYILSLSTYTCLLLLKMYHKNTFHVLNM